MKQFLGRAAGVAVSAFSRFYEGANAWSRERTFIDNEVSDNDQTLDRSARSEMSGIARNVYVNVGFVRGAVNDIARYTIGGGINPQPLVAKENAVKYREYWDRFSAQCELSGKFSFPQYCNLASKCIDVDGDIGTIFTEDEATRFPQLQYVLSHRIGDGRDRKPATRDGVVLGKYERPVFYRVIVNKKGDTVDVPASAFHLLGDPDRPDAYRFASGLAHALNNARDKKDILGFEKIGVKNNASITNTLESAAGATNQPFFGKEVQTTGTGQQSISTEKLRAGGILKLLPGEKFQAHESNRPSPTFTGFLGYLDRDVAVGLGVPLEFVWDPTLLGGANTRFALAKAQRRFDERQNFIFLPFILRVYIYVIAKGIENGDLPFDPAWFRVQFHRPAKMTVDVGREASANREDVWAGLRTPQEDYEERGVNFLNARNDLEASAIDLLERADRLVQKFPFLDHAGAIALLEKRGASQIVLEQPKPEPKQITDKK